MKFDVVVGNPPYQDNIENRGEQPAIYNYFYDLAKKVSGIYCLISPARFLFNAGSTNSQWNEMMLTDTHLKVLYYTQKAADLFPNTDIKGGVAIVYRNSSKEYGPIGTFTNYPELNSIIKKVISEDFHSINELLHSNTSYKYSEELWKENSELVNRVSGGSRRYLSSSVFDKMPELFSDEKPLNSQNYVEITGRQNNKRITKWMKRKYLAPHENIDKYKAVLPSSNGSGYLGEVLSDPFIGEPNNGYTETFISFGSFDEAYKAENLLKYLKTKFARTMLGVVKVTPGNKSKKVWSKVPMQDFTEESDIDWNRSLGEIDQQLFEKYNLDAEEIEFISKTAKKMN